MFSNIFREAGPAGRIGSTRPCGRRPANKQDRGARRVRRMWRKQGGSKKPGNEPGFSVGWSDDRKNQRPNIMPCITPPKKAPGFGPPPPPPPPLRRPPPPPP